jgi:hypothetical protein
MEPMLIHVKPNLDQLHQSSPGSTALTRVTEKKRCPSAVHQASSLSSTGRHEKHQHNPALEAFKLPVRDCCMPFLPLPASNSTHTSIHEFTQLAHTCAALQQLILANYA